MTLLDDFNAYVVDVSASTVYKKWAGGSPGEVTQWQAVVSAIRGGNRPPLPTLSSSFGRSLIDEARLYLDATAAAPAPTPTPTPAPSPMASFVGLCAYQESDLATIAALGIRHVRSDQGNVSASFVKTATSLRIEVLPIACYCPWGDLNGGQGDKYPPTPANVPTWAVRQVQTLKANYGTVVPEALEPWNEPWLTDFWQPGPNPAAYLALVKAFAAEAWKVWPLVKILVSADTLGTNYFQWRTGLLAADTAGFLNDPRIFATSHCYTEGRTPQTVTGDPCYWDFDRYKCAYQDFKAHGNGNGIWVTEFGYESGVVGEANQAAYTTDALTMAKASGIVARCYAFHLRAGDNWDYDWLRPDGSQKPVCAAVRSLVTA